MCGLVGAVGSLSPKMELMFKDMLIMDVLRGPHSTGMVSVSRDKKMAYAKSAMLPTDLMQTKQWKDAVPTMPALYMGHNRYATVGKVNTASAHPFEMQNIIGMHNGTLRGWHNALRGSAGFTVDSECLLHNIDQYGMEAFDRLEGAWAVTWYDARDNTFNIVRNSERPLYTRRCSEERVMFYASEAWMISAAAKRHGVALSPTTYDVPTGKHLKWRLPTEYNQALPKEEVTEVEFYTPQVTNYNFRGEYLGSSSGFRDTGNVSRLPPPKDKKEEKALASYVGKEVEFYAVDFQETNAKTGAGTITGVMTEDPWYEVIVRTSKEIADDIMAWRGVCSNNVLSVLNEYRVNGKVQGGFLVVSDDGISLIEEDDSDVDVQCYDGPKGQVTEQEFLKLTESGCSFCGGNIDLADHEDIEWQDGKPLCSPCCDYFAAPEFAIN